MWTMPQNGVDGGRPICEVSVATLRPTEFVIVRVGHKTAPDV
jgi:hypothetical protein